MANTITNLIPIIHEALDVVSRELTGIISAVTLDANAESVAKGQTVYSPTTPVSSQGDIAPAMVVTAAADQVISTKSIVIDNHKVAGFNWTAEEAFSVGSMFAGIVQDQIAQCFRVHVNAIESALAVAAKNGASRAIGTTAGTAPILADFAGAKKILDDNGAPQSNRSVILDTTAGAALRGIANLYKVNEGGDSALLRQGVLGDLYGFGIRESAGVIPVAAGTLSGASTASGALTVGQTTLTLKTTTGTGAVVAGDIITLANDTNKYVVVSTNQAGANPGTGETITIAAPGIRVAQSAAERAITVFAASTRNIAMSRNAVVLATRLPKFQAEDDAPNRYAITDPRTGISFEITRWPGQRMLKYEVAIAYGMAVVKPEHLAIIVG